MNVNEFKAWLWSWLQQLLFRRRPQDDVLSYAALKAAFSGYLLVDLLQAFSSWPALEAVAVSLLDVAVMIVFTLVVLRIARKIPRLVQTLTALAGTGALLGFLGLPLFLLAANSEGAVQGGGVVLGWLVLFAWHVGVQAHIFRHALSARFSIGLAVAVLHAVVMIALLEVLFPHAVDSGGF